MSARTLRRPLIGAICSAMLALGVMVGSAEAASVPESPDPIRLAKYDWTGQYVTIEVAAEILRRMGYNVEVVQTTQVPSLQAISDGEITASLEWWNQANKAIYDKAVDEKKIDPLGPTGLVGSEGWYYPTYITEKCPGLPDWQALQKCADIFATPETSPKGRVLDYPAEWNPDAQKWIDALGLNLVAVASGGEGATAAEIKSAVARQEPILLQWWEPTWLVSEFKLNIVKLDTDGTACAKANEAKVETTKMFDCAGKQIGIVKYVWPGTKDKWPAAYKFLQVYQMTNDWQGPMAKAIEIEGKKVEDVAKAWVDANEATWKPWVEQATK